MAPLRPSEADPDAVRVVTEMIRDTRWRISPEGSSRLIRERTQQGPEGRVRVGELLHIVGRSADACEVRVGAEDSPRLQRITWRDASHIAVADASGWYRFGMSRE